MQFLIFKIISYIDFRFLKILLILNTFKDLKIFNDYNAFILTKFVKTMILILFINLLKSNKEIITIIPSTILN